MSNKLIVFLILFSTNISFAQESWTITSQRHYNFLGSLLRSQGVTTDNQGHFWFSSKLSLIKTNSQGGVTARADGLAIPYSLLKNGTDHIGDISYYNGKIIAPMEDGKKYLHPHIGIFNAKTFAFEKKFALPWEQQKDGVPWVAVDPTRAQIYSSEYSDMNKINVYDIQTLQPLGFIQSSRTLHSVQGGKYHNGYLYLTANGETSGFSIYRMGLDDGQVIEVAKFPDNLDEVEGLTFVTDKNGQDKILALGMIKLYPKATSGFLAKLHISYLYTFEMSEPTNP
jgi:hypothetical protein